MRITITVIALTCGVMSQSGPVTAAVTSQQTIHLNSTVSRHFTLAGDRGSLGPMTYKNWTDQLRARAKRNADDRAWALANVTPVVEGPWGSIHHQCTSPALSSHFETSDDMHLDSSQATAPTFQPIVAPRGGGRNGELDFCVLQHPRCKRI